MTQHAIEVDPNLFWPNQFGNPTILCSSFSIHDNAWFFDPCFWLKKSGFHTMAEFKIRPYFLPSKFNVYAQCHSLAVDHAFNRGTRLCLWPHHSYLSYCWDNDQHSLYITTPKGMIIIILLVIVNFTIKKIHLDGYYVKIRPYFFYFLVYRSADFIFCKLK